MDNNTNQKLRNISYNNQARHKLRSSLEDKCKEITTNKWTLEIIRALNSFTELTVGENIKSNVEVLVLHYIFLIKMICFSLYVEYVPSGATHSTAG